MPTYEYECRACGHRFEKRQPITAAAIKMCPACSKKKVVRLIGAGGGLIFKGSGFYATDHRKGAGSDVPKCPVAGDKPDCARCPKNPS